MSAFLAQYQAVVALFILAMTFIAFLFERYPPAVIAISGASVFLLLGYIDSKDVMAVFSNSAPITIAAMFILSGALVRTGTLEAAGTWVTARAADRPFTALLLLVTGTAAASAFMNNTPVVLVLMPIAVRLATSSGIAPTQTLIPLSYSAILGGTCTLIGTSTNLLVDGVARRQGMAPFSIFEITPVGIVVATVGLMTMLLLSRVLLPARAGSTDVVDEANGAMFLTELTVSKQAGFVGKAIGQVNELNRPGTRMLAFRRGSQTWRDDLAERTLQAGDRIVILANMAEVLTLHAETGFEVLGVGALDGDRDRIIVEAVFAPSRGAPALALGEMRLARFGVRVLGVSRHRHIPGQDLRSVRVRAADRLLLEGSSEGLAAAAEEGNLINISHPRSRSFRRRKAPVAIAALGGVVGLAALNVMPVEALAFLAIAAILLVRCVDAEEAWQSIDGNVLILIFAMLAIGAGLEKTGAIRLIVDGVTPMLAHSSPLIVLATLYLVAMLLTELVTNNAVAVILTPLAIALAGSLGIDARPLVVAIMFGASASFATPIGYQTNTMVYAAGNYRFVDFLRIGVPMNLIVGIATCVAIVLMMPLSK